MRTERELENMSFSVELANAAFKAAKVVCSIRENENVLIVDETASDPRIREALAGAAHLLGARVSVMTFETSEEPMQEPPPPVAAAMKASDVIIDYCEHYLLYTRAQTEALDHIRVWLGYGGMDVPTFVRMVGKVDYENMIALGECLVDLTSKAKKIRITNGAGTEITAENGGRHVEQYGGIYNMPRGPMKQIMPPGQVGWCPMEETIDGIIAIDAFLWPPDEIGALPKNPIKLRVRKGLVEQIDGAIEAEIFRRWLSGFNDPLMYRIAHFTYGICPTAKLSPTTTITEGERFFGNFEFGIGTQGPLIRGKGWKAASHCDGTISAPSVWLDDVQIEKDGKWTHPKLVELSRKMKIKGY